MSYQIHESFVLRIENFGHLMPLLDSEDIHKLLSHDAMLRLFKSYDGHFVDILQDGK